MKQKLKLFSGLFLSLALALSLMPCMSLTVYADTAKAYSAYDATTETNKTNDLTALQVTFNERQWYIIEDNSSSATSGTVTLLSADTTFGTKEFDDDSNKYSTSQVKTYLDSMTGTGGAFAGVAEAIETVNLTTNKYNSTDVYETVNNVKLYLLSTEEAKSLPENVRKAEFTGENFSDNEWWLRSPGLDQTHAAFVKGDSGYFYDDGEMVPDALGVRPALKLNLESVIFDSASKTFSCIPSLGTGAIINPTQPSAATDPWKGNYVYYGKYGGTPTKYRVLDKASSDFGVTGNSLLLDCDNVLYEAKFDADTNDWANSDVKAGLNGDSFLTKAGNFTAVESSAIAESIKADASLGDGDGWLMLGYASLNGEKIFLLDAKEATRTSYGYSDTQNSAKNREKTGSVSVRWLRSPYSGANELAGRVNGEGVLNENFAGSDLGVSPAFNVSLSSVIFSSLVSGTAGAAGAEYKLTLKDPGLTIAAGAVQDESVSNKYHIPYAIADNSSSADPTQVSVVVTDKPWTENGWTEGANLLQYSKLEMNTFSLSGTGTFTLDGSITGTLGTNYHLYVLAEDKNGEKETDFASEPVEIEAIPSYLLKYAPGDGGTGSMASKSVSPTEVFTFPECGFTAPEGKSFYHWKMSGEDGIYSPNGTVTIADNCAQNGVVTVTAYWIDQPAAKVTTHPTAKTLIYTGSPQALVNSGVAEDGTMKYALGDSANTAPTSGWDTAIPKGTEAKTYYVWYKVFGDDTHSDTTPVPLTVTIKNKPSPTPTPPSPSPSKPAAYVKTAPVANTLTYSEQPQGLVTAGESTGGEMLYALGNSKSSMPTSGWSTSIPTATDAGTYFVWYKAKGDSSHTNSSSKCVTVTIGKVSSAVTTVPTVKSLLYSGEPQELLTAGEASGGTMQYAVGTDPTTAPTDGWSTEIPKVTDAGTYYIWYKVVGDNNHEDTEPSYAGATTIIENHSDNVLSIDEEKGIATVRDDVSGGTEEVPLNIITEGLIYRMYDPNRGEHFYTKDPEEAELLVQLGWIHESGSDFAVVSATEEDAVPVYRLYNPNCGGMHFFTADAEEAKYLKSIGWNYEGISHYVYTASSTKGTPQYRLYNPNSPSGEHNWTSDEAEVDMLKKAGWVYEGICWRIV